VCFGGTCLAELPQSLFTDDFACTNDAWSYENPSDPSIWSIDATPGVPGFFSADCSLNFNDGKTIAGPGGTVSGTATSPPFIATKPESPDHKLFLEFMSYQDVESSASYDITTVSVEEVAGPATVKVKLPKQGLKTWVKQSIDISSLHNKAVQIVFTFSSVDSVSNNGKGIFIDDVVVFAK